MARFPHYKSNIRELGKLIAQASVDQNFRSKLKQDPASFMEEIGLPEQTTKLMKFSIVDASEHPNAMALPFRLNQAKLDSGNEAYLRGLASFIQLN